MIIHISGPSGSGKTFLGNKLKENFGSKIVVKDLDDLRYEFIINKYGSYKNMWKKKILYGIKMHTKIGFMNI